jgi:hypothetical protein
MMDIHLQTAMRATVRVENATGIIIAATRAHSSVIVTAAHVVEEVGSAFVRWCEGEEGHEITQQELVMARDSEFDLAFVNVPPEIESRGIELGDVEPGDDIWLLGYPSGWSLGMPLISKGVLSGISPRSIWVDGSASWGHSGGPVITLDADAPRVVGTIVGAAGRVQEELEKLIKTAKREQKLVEDMTADRVAHHITPESALGLAGHATTRVSQAMELIRAHFRAGFVEVVPAHAIRRLRG